jgi:hypothetical protein
MSEPIMDEFFSTLPVFSRFEGVTDNGNYRPLPDDWHLALADIVSSTQAIAAGRYKAVNMAGASVISAILNALGKGDYPFVFGGDGAMVAIPAAGVERVRKALAAVQRFVAEELELSLRVALVPMTGVRAEGLDVRVARFGASPLVSYAMFSGGGANWAEKQMKAGKYGVDPAAAADQPDLTGLSCRWNPIKSRHGSIVSIIAVPGEEGNGPEFQRLVADVIAISTEQSREGHPVPEEGPSYSLTLSGLEAELRATAKPGNRLWRRLSIIGQMIMMVPILRLNMVIGPFSAKTYKHDLAANSDFRKFDDGLKMTLDVDQTHLSRIEERLKEAERLQICRYGLYRQDAALMTCFVPTPLARDHMHFIDGADGGYATAASRLGDKPQAGPPPQSAGRSAPPRREVS